MPPPTASVPTDALSKWRLWEDKESLREVAKSLVMREYMECDLKEDALVLLLADKGDQYKGMKAADVKEIWECIKEKADDDRNPYRELLAAKKDGSWDHDKNLENLISGMQNLAASFQRLAAKIDGQLNRLIDALPDEEPGEGSSSRIQELSED